jgi:hypothetical protein
MKQTAYYAVADSATFGSNGLKFTSSQHPVDQRLIKRHNLQQVSQSKQPAHNSWLGTDDHLPLLRVGIA